MVQGIGTFPALTEDIRTVSSTQVSQYTTAYNVSPRVLDTCLSASATCTHVHTHTQRHIHRNKNKSFMKRKIGQ